MKTLYIDIYFLINFTVDFLAIYLSLYICKEKSTIIRIVLAAVAGAIFACVTVLFNIAPILYAAILILTGLIISVTSVKSKSPIRTINFFLIFILLETLFGGAVSFFFNLLDERLGNLLASMSFGAENKKVLVLSLVVLLVFAMLKLIFFIIGDIKYKKNYELTISVLSNELKIDALLDSGNLLKDPMDNSSVVIVKKNKLSLFYKLWGSDIMRSLDTPVAKRIRIIPTNGVGGEKILMGIKTDYVIVSDGKKSKKFDAVIAIDELDGTFNGYGALIPAALTEI